MATIGNPESGAYPGSAFSDPKVQKGMESLQSQSQSLVGVGLSNNVRPNGFAFSDSKVRTVMENLQKQRRCWRWAL